MIKMRCHAAQALGFSLLTLCMPRRHDGVFKSLSLHPQPDVNDNKIPEVERPVQPTVNEVDIVQNRNEIPLLTKDAEPAEEHPSNVLMSHASDESIFNKTEVLAGQYPSWMVVHVSIFFSCSGEGKRSEN